MPRIALEFESFVSVSPQSSKIMIFYLARYTVHSLFFFLKGESLLLIGARIYMAYLRLHSKVVGREKEVQALFNIL